MPASEIDAYLAGLDEPKRSTLDEVRRRILEVVPDAEQTISYACPAFKNHLSYLPHSGSTLGELKDDVKSYEQTKSALHFAVDKPLPKALIKKLVTTRMRQAGL